MAVDQQNVGIGQIFTAITDLSKMMDETLSRIESTNTAATTLRAASQQLDRMLMSYKV